MNNPNIYQLMKASNQIDHLVEKSSNIPQDENGNLSLWVICGVLILGLVYYWNHEKEKIHF